MYKHATFHCVYVSHTIATSAKCRLALRGATPDVNSRSHTELRRRFIMSRVMPNILLENSETLEDDGHVDDRSQLDCTVGHAHDDNTSTSTGRTTVKYKARSRGLVVAPSATSRSSRFINRVMAAANVPKQLSDEPLCGEVSESRAEQTSENQSISLTGHPADNPIQSGMSDVA